MTGIEAFSKLCEQLIDDGHNYLYPCIERTKSTAWMATIKSHHDNERAIKWAYGQAESMEDACADAVRDYNERQRIRARKNELLQNPEVVEALKLWKIPHEKMEGER